MTAKKIALFIDADNISAKFGKQIFDALEHRGEIFIRRIYGNWEKQILRGWNDCILNFSLRPMQQIDFATGKNATDMSLTIDAMDVLHDGKAEIFALVSNDSDFTPLAIRLREGGMTVIGLGGGQVSNSFRVACSEFIDLAAQTIAPVEVQPPQPPPAVVKKKSPAPKKNPSAQMSLFDTEDTNGVITFYPPQVSQVSQVSQLPEIIPAPVPVNPKVIPISETKIKNDGDKKLQQIHAVLRETAKIHGDTNGLVNLSWAGDALGKKNISLKGSGHSTLSKFIAAFPNLYEMRKSGGTFCYRCLANASKNPVAEDKLQPIHAVLREAAAAHKDLNDANGYTALNRAGLKAHEIKLDIKNFGYSSWSKFVADFPKLYAVKKVGTIIYYRCR